MNHTDKDRVDTFISYSRENLDFVRRLAELLTQNAKRPWFDQDSIPFGSKWWDEITQGIENTHNFLFVVSPASLVSSYCHAEIAHALSHDKRIVTILYLGSGTERDCLNAIDRAIDAIPDNEKLPASAGSGGVALREIARTHWIELSAIQYVQFSDDVANSIDGLIEALDLDIEWRRMHTQLRQAAKLWHEKEESDDYLWPQGRLRPIYEMIKHIQPELDDVERRFIVPEQDRLLDELADIDTLHQRRLLIGERLAAIGDARGGVGLDEAGVPDIVWHRVEPAGEVFINGQRLQVEPFCMARYQVTVAQFQAFLDDPEGFNSDRWWDGFGHKYRQRETNPPQVPFNNHPRDSITWFQAVAFTRWLTYRLLWNKWPAEAEPGWSIRLPTEWEFQWAAQGFDEQRLYPWGAWDPRYANTLEAGIGERVTAVGMYPQGAAVCGVQDMSGSLWEWCLNEYADIRQVNFSSNNERALRGGSFYHTSSSATCSSRNKANPNDWSFNVGFRVVCARSLGV